MIEDNFYSQNAADAIYSVIDFETTGISAYSNRVIEVGITKISKLKIIDRYTSFINPGCLIPYYITDLTGIANDDVDGAPYFTDIADEILDFIKDTVLVAHNYVFDYNFLKNELERCGKKIPKINGLCTLRLARRFLIDIKPKSLSNICNCLRIDTGNSHRALDDTIATSHLLIYFIKSLKNQADIISVNDLLTSQYVVKSTVKKHVETTFDYRIPHHPGIYYFLNKKEKIIYIGKAKFLDNRIKSHFSSSTANKSKKIVKQASKIKTVLTRSELTAYLLEAYKIKEEDPRLNTMLKQYGSKYFLKINLTHSFPNVEITSSFDFDGNDYFGLFISRKKANIVYDLINKVFALRECKEKEFKKGRGCLLSELERCTAPCVNKDKEIYNNELDKVYNFLYGNQENALNRMLFKMKDYSQKLLFEKAGEVKEIVDLILAQVHKSSLLSEPVNSANVLMVIDEGFGIDVVLLVKGKVFIRSYEENDFEFDNALDDFYEKNINSSEIPDEEDLERMKIILNWVVKNRNKVKIYYLKDYSSKTELFNKVNIKFFNKRQNKKLEICFDIKESDLI